MKKSFIRTLKQKSYNIVNLYNSLIRQNWAKVILPLIGAGSLIWFLIRVIPKPSRASYPCMRVAAPMASSFVLWLLGIVASITAFKKMKSAYLKSSYTIALLFLIIGISFTIFTASQSAITLFAGVEKIETVAANNPIGEAKGINPGRVVWVWNPNSTNENCTNKYTGSINSAADENDDGWFLNKNNNQEEIDRMLSNAVKELTGEESDYEAWDAIFKYFNNNKHDRNEGYSTGEKIFIKLNATSGWGRGASWGNITNDNRKMQNNYYPLAETSPQLILSLLRQLVNVYGVAQEDISVGDPMKFIYKHCYNIWYAEFPNIHYIDNLGTTGREKVVATADTVIRYSDRGAVLRASGTSGNPVLGDKIYTVMNDADYLINVPTMKGHARAGVTLFAKNHFGSHSRSGAEHLHGGLVAPNEGAPTRTDSSIYRIQVDLMGHEKFGGNTVFFLLDALWAGPESVWPPAKWHIAPFNNDWTSSIFLSQDPVAIESVAWDLLSTEYNGTREIETVWDNKPYIETVNFPVMQGTTDYLRQAADPSFWPNGIVYDPEGDGTPIGSLGVTEHWNNPTDRKYSRNLGTGNGIELVYVDQSVTDIEVEKDITIPEEFVLHQNYPNPFNPSTKISFSLNETGTIKLAVYDILGNMIKELASGDMTSGMYEYSWDGKNSLGNSVSSGTYVYRLMVNNGKDGFAESRKMNLVK